MELTSPPFSLGVLTSILVQTTHTQNNHWYASWKTTRNRSKLLRRKTRVFLKVQLKYVLAKMDSAEDLETSCALGNQMSAGLVCLSQRCHSL